MKIASYLAFAMLIADTIFQMLVDLSRMTAIPTPVVIIAALAFPMLVVTLVQVLLELGRSMTLELRVQP